MRFRLRNEPVETINHFVLKFYLPIIFISGLLDYLHSQVISEIMPQPEIAGEWIEIYNTQSEILDISGYSIVDAAGNACIIESFFERSELQVFIEPNSFLVLAPDVSTYDELEIPSSLRLVYAGRWPGLNNDGDTLWLYNADGTAIDTITYSSTPAQLAGTSWERVDPFSSGLDQSNWGYCTSVHSAGKINSLKPVTNNSVQLEVNPNPFNPETGEAVSIKFAIPSRQSKLSIKIFDLNSRFIAEVANNRIAGTDTPVISWDGRDYKHDIVPVGRYIVVLSAIDNISGKSYQGRCTVVRAARL